MSAIPFIDGTATPSPSLYWMAGIGTLREGSLHAALKQWAARPGDRFEQPVDSFIVDILRGDDVVEIQTGNFASMRRKLAALTATRRVHVVHPVAVERWIVRGEQRRRSPRRRELFSLFEELVSIPEIASRDTFSLEVVLISEEEFRRPSRRRGRWTVVDRRLLAVHDSARFHGPADFASLLPDVLRERFTNADLAAALKRPRWLAEKMTYSLRKMGAIDVVDRRGLANVYRRAA